MRVLILAALMLLGVMLVARADTAPSSEPLPPNIEALLSLLADPGVQKWLETHKAASATTQVPPITTQAPHLSHPLADYVGAVRAHIHGLARALTTLPDEFAAAWSILVADAEKVGLAGLVGLFGLFAAAAFGAERLYRRATSGFMTRVAQLDVATRRGQVMVLASRLAHDVGRVAVIAAAGIGVFVALHYWPEVIEKIVLACLLAFIIVLLARAVLRFLLSPPGKDANDLRIVPMDGKSARFWTQRLGLVVIILAVSYATTLSLSLLGFSVEAREIVAYSLGLGLLGVGIDTVRRAPGPAIADAATDGEVFARAKTSVGLISAYFVLLWCLWAFGAVQLFWLAAIAIGLVWAIAIAERIVVHLLQQPASFGIGAATPSAGVTLLSRGIRFILIISGLLLLAWAWNIDLIALSAADTPPVRVAHGIISAVIILLVADLVWRVLRTLIDNQIAKVRDTAVVQTEETQRRSRLNTLLPILRNFLWATLAIVAILMALSAMGVQIGPLIAGAGIAGVAIGFGAQTLVKDILSGVFFLLDDAFRVGEYIESGNYKGTVESFSLRSVKLRHSRGPIFTVPFGVLGAVQNMSRDWVIEKLSLTITYDSDLEKARKLIKKIGLELAEDPELKAITIEPLKMQGVEEFGEYGVKLRLKLKTKPGQQAAVRRRALVMIKTAFDENGICFASKAVQVSSAAGSQPEAVINADAALHATTTPQKPVAA
ncbi:mechanosensitive ion channel [Rhizobium leguminosarum]|uniref:mechanosensitive ion channel family protein n=1 Tax=Rhizobium ruizarguesonis TaxID=2081791 RepID=UPI0013E0B02D|nr:mechanosensitive ion channel family protein [Rhizobium ruizarguesonis]NEJ91406.1 mechanosensitive ion channel [Rhizobium ruizarguesonis]